MSDPSALFERISAHAMSLAANDMRDYVSGMVRALQDGRLDPARIEAWRPHQRGLTLREQVMLHEAGIRTAPAHVLQRAAAAGARAASEDAAAGEPRGSR